MSRLKKYLLHFRGVPEGRYDYKYIVKDSFFENFPESVIKKCEVNVGVTMAIRSRFIELKFNLIGIINLDCDVCLDDFDLPIEYNTNLKVSFSKEGSDITNVYDHIILADTENDIQLAQHIYEYIHLCIPSKVVHGLDKDGIRECNPNMLAKLEELRPTIDEEEIDHRWDKLKNLKF